MRGQASSSWIVESNCRPPPRVCRETLATLSVDMNPLHPCCPVLAMVFVQEGGMSIQLNVRWEQRYR